MYPDELYQLAFAFRKTKLWKSLGESELFAVELPNDEIGYCCVQSFASEHNALALYVGNKGLDSFRALRNLDRMETSQLKIYETALGRDCLQCSFESKGMLHPDALRFNRVYASEHGISFRGANAFPQFLNFHPARTAWPVSKQEEIELLCTALEAALEVSRQVKNGNKIRLGFQEGAMYNRSIPLLARSGDGFVWGLHPLPPKQSAQYPEPTLKDEVLMARLKKERKRRNTWVCDVVLMPYPDMDQEDSIPIFPYTLLSQICETRKTLPPETVPNLEEGTETLLRVLGNWMLENKIPREIQVVDRRTYSMLKNLTATLNIKLVLQSENAVLDELEDGFLNFVKDKLLGSTKR